MKTWLIGVAVACCVVVAKGAEMGKVVNVHDSGAIPNDGKDDTTGIVKAVEYAVKTGAR